MAPWLCSTNMFLPRNLSRNLHGLRRVGEGYMEAVLRESRSLGVNWDFKPVVLACKHDKRLPTWSDVPCLSL